MCLLVSDKTSTLPNGNFATQKSLISVKEDLLRKSPNSLQELSLTLNYAEFEGGTPSRVQL
jgi:hypothetical protein